jgi:hypothetical protein
VIDLVIHDTNELASTGDFFFSCVTDAMPEIDIRSIKECPAFYLEMNTLQARARLFLGRRSHQSLAPHEHPSPAVANDLVISTVDENSGIAMLTMNRPPANSLSLEM